MKEVKYWSQPNSVSSASSSAPRNNRQNRQNRWSFEGGLNKKVATEKGKELG
jgi:hypothetical protein